MNEHELLYLLKHGRAEELRILAEQSKTHSYSNDFPAFMEMMLKEHNLKRKEVAIRAGMSQDYTYKLLRGAKKTKERDYILALCIATGMNFAQIQHALRIYGMPVLDNRDHRSHVIMLGIEEKQDIDHINDWLKKAGLNYLKTSPDMPSSNIEPIMTGDPDEYNGNLAALITNGNPENFGKNSYVIDPQSFEEIEYEVHAERCGQASMDYAFWGEIKIQGEEGKAFYILGNYHPEAESFYVMDSEMHEKLVEQKIRLYEGEELRDGYCDPKSPLIKGVDIIEAYQSLVAAAGSPFFKWFLALDSYIDDKVIETLQNIDDTRFSGARFGTRLSGGEMTHYMEAFNTSHPEKREYFQVIESGDELRFTASHESYFMRIELGEIYTEYFGKKAIAPEYFINVTDLKELNDKNYYYKHIFRELLAQLHKYMHYYGIEISKEVLDKEESSSLIRQAAVLSNDDQHIAAAHLLEKAYALLKKDDSQNCLPVKVVTSSKLADLYYELGDDIQRNKWISECYSYKDALKHALEIAENHMDFGDAPICMGQACFIYSNRAKNSNLQKAKELLLEAINFYNGYCQDVESWEVLADLLASYAFMIDAESPEEALDYTEEALDIIRDQALDRRPEYHERTVTALNNHAWVLWNRLTREEAIIYYGRAVDLIQGYLKRGTPDPEKMKAALLKESSALYKIYLAANREKEACRLAKKMEQFGISLNEGL